MLGILVMLATALCLGFLVLCTFELARRNAQRRAETRSHLMNYDEQLRVLRLLRRVRATLEEVLDPLLEPELDELRSLVRDLDEALEMYYKS